MQSSFKANIKFVIDLVIDPKSKAYFHCTGNPNTIEVVKNQLRLLRELRNEIAALKWIRVEPVKIGGKEYYQILKISLSGRNNSWYQFKRINTFMFLPDGYPAEKPVIFFEDLTDSKGKDHVFEHVNVFQDPRGRLCLEAIQDNYASSMTLADILAALERCIYEDNVKSPANGAFARVKNVNPAEYAKKLNAQSQMLGWLEESEVPKDENSDDD